jgi:hypothetical protein
MNPPSINAIDYRIQALKTMIHAGGLSPIEGHLLTHLLSTNEDLKCMVEVFSKIPAQE